MRALSVRPALFPTLLAAFLAGSAAAQFPQYTAPGSLANPAAPTLDRVETGIEGARWELGPVRVDPRLWLGGPSYNDNVFSDPDHADQVSDVSATVGAGLVTYTRLGSDVVVSAYLLPAYTWWQDQDQLSESQLSAGVGIFGFYNRLELLADARREERQRFLSSEFQVPFDIRSDRARLRADVDLRGPWELFGAVEIEEIGHSGGAAQPSGGVRIEDLDRDEAIGRLGGGYRFSSGLRVALGVEVAEADFLIDPAGRSNSSFGPLLEVTFEGHEVDAAANLVLREVDFDGVEETNSELSGYARLGWQPRHRLRLDLYGGRSLVYSVQGAETYFNEDRLGLSVGSPRARRLSLRAFVEAGTNDYQSLTGPPNPRQDDFASLGAEADLRISSNLAVGLAAVRSDFDSNLPGLDRRVTVLEIGARVGGDPRPW